MINKETRKTIRELLDSETFELADAKGAIRNMLAELDTAEEEIERLQKEYEDIQQRLIEVHHYSVRFDELMAENKYWKGSARNWRKLSKRYRKALEDITEESSDIYAIRKARNALKGESE